MDFIKRFLAPVKVVKPRTFDAEHQENINYYLAGQPEDDIIELTPAMMIKDGHKLLSANEIESQAKAVLAKLPVVDYDNSWSVHHCTTMGCTKMMEGCCMAYLDPTRLSWHRQGKECPTGPYQFHLMKSLKKKKINPLKASKRNNR